MTNREISPVLLSAFALLTIAVVPGCKLTPHKSSAESVEAKPVSAQASAPDDLQVAMNKLDDSLHKPTVPFHVSFKKSSSDGFIYQCEADVSPGGITGQQTDISPTTHIGDDVFPASTRVRPLNGTPYGSPDFTMVYSGMAMAYLNSHIRDAQPGVKYAGDEQTGGYDARRYNIDLTGVDADIKKAMNLANTLGAGHSKDYNVKGTAWVAKEDGRMVKFSFDNIFTFADDKTSSTHFEGAVTRK